MPAASAGSGVDICCRTLVRIGAMLCAAGLPANGTIAAEVAYMFNEWYRPDCMLEFPIGGSQAMVGALVR
jgi:hypothetical protein